MPGRVVRKATYIKEYHELTKKDGIPFVPDAVWKDLFFGAFILLSVAACALYFGPFGPSGPPDPTIIQTVATPGFFLPVALRGALILAAFHGNSRAAHRARRCDSRAAAVAVRFRRRRKKLAAQAHCRTHHSAGGGCAWERSRAWPNIRRGVR